MSSRKPATITPEVAYSTLATAANINVGDTVRVLRSFKDYELGAPVEWDDDMKSLVGDEFRVTDLYDNGTTYELDNAYNWPFFVLEKVTNTLEFRINDEYIAEISEDGTSMEVGCQDIDADTIFKLADHLRQVQADHAAKQPKPRARRRR